MEMRTEVSHALRGHPVRCDRTNYYGMPTGPFAVLRAAERTAKRRAAAHGVHAGGADVTAASGGAGRDPPTGTARVRRPASAAALDYGFAATSRNR